MQADLKDQRVPVMMSASDLKRLDAWRRDQDDLPSRGEAIRRLIEVGLTPRADIPPCAAADSAPTLIGAIIAHCLLTFADVDQDEFSDDDVQRDVALAVISMLRAVDLFRTDNIVPDDHLRPLVEALGGLDYVIRTLQWRRDTEDWDRSRKQNKPPRPAAPVPPGWVRQARS